MKVIGLMLVCVIGGVSREIMSRMDSSEFFYVNNLQSPISKCGVYSNIHGSGLDTD